MSEFWQDVYGSVEAWEAERHGTVEEAERERYHAQPRKFGAGRGSDTEGAAARNSRPTLFERELADTIQAARLKRERRP